MRVATVGSLVEEEVEVEVEAPALLVCLAISTCLLAASSMNLYLFLSALPLTASTPDLSRQFSTFMQSLPYWSTALMRSLSSAWVQRFLLCEEVSEARLGRFFLVVLVALRAAR